MISDDGNGRLSLKAVASKRLVHPIKFPFTAFSHEHDLLAVVSLAIEVQVFRIISGQVAFAIKRQDAPRDTELHVTALAWRADGKRLGIGWNDGKYGIYDGGSGRQMSLTELRMTSGEEPYVLDLALPKVEAKVPGEKKAAQARVECFGFMGHSGVATEEAAVNFSPEVHLSTEYWYDELDTEGHDPYNDSQNSRSSEKATISDLPRALAALDVATVLPRLSAIPSHGLTQPKTGPGANKFGSQAATDTQFAEQSDPSSNTVESLLVFQNDGSIHVLLNETVKIGTCRYSGRPIRHAANSRSPTHALLCEDLEASHLLAVTFVDLPLSTLSGPLLHVIATNTKRIQTLLDYVVQTLRCIEFDYLSNTRSPQHLMELLADDFAKKYPTDGDVVSNIYHLAMTGSFHPQIFEWIDDVLKAGFGRWEKLYNTMYSNIQEHLFVNLLPALDRFSIAVTNLRGQAQFYDGTTQFDCEPQLFSNVLNNIDSIRLVAQKMQLIVASEHREFRAFAKWMKMQIDIATAKPFTPTALEIEEREVPTIDYPLVLTYIKNNMLQSKLAPHIENRPDMEEGQTCHKNDFFSNPIIKDLNYERSKEAMKQLNAKQDSNTIKVRDVDDPMVLLNLPALTCSLIGRVRVALQRITEWQNNTLFPPPFSPPTMTLKLDPGTYISDMTITLNEPARTLPTGNSSTKLLGLQTSLSNKIDVLELQPTASGKKSSAYATPIIHRSQHAFSSQILDAKFVPHTPATFLTLFNNEGTGDGFQVVRHNISRTDDGDGEVKSEVLYKFESDTTFKPDKLLVGGRKGKLLCIVFGGRGREWKVLDLDGGMQHGIAGGEGGDWDVENAMMEVA